MFVSDRQLSMDQLANVASGEVLAVGNADVGRSRERSRRTRLWRIAGMLAIPTAWLWYRLADSRPFDVFAVPHINLLYAVPFAFFALLILLMGGMHFATGKSPHQVV